MNRICALIVVALLAVGLAMPAAMVATAAPVHASGCGNNGTWQQVAYRSGEHTDVSGYKAWTDITVWRDGCGDSQARFSIWAQLGIDHSLNYHVAWRMWVGGSLISQVMVHDVVGWTGWQYVGNQSFGVDNALLSTGYSTIGCTPNACYDAGHDWPYGWYLDATV